MLSVNWFKKNLTLLLISITVLSSLIPLASKVLAQSSSCEDLSGITVDKTIETTSTYALWVRLKSETSGAKSAIRINGGDCIELAQSQNNDWNWVSGASGLITANLMGGESSFQFNTTSGTILFDKVLATNDTSCTPTDDGSNCISQPLNMNVRGISAGGDRILDARSISVEFAEGERSDVEVFYYIDDTLIKSTTISPYCLEGEASPCGRYDFSTLDIGSHVLKVVVHADNGEMAERSFPFELTNPSIPSPDIPVIVPNTPNNTPTNSSLPEIQINIVGVTDNETIRGSRKIEAKLTNVTGEASVKFELNGEIMNNDYTSPFCFSSNNGSCADWNSLSMPNNTYPLEVTAAAKGYKTTKKTIQLKFDNSFVAPTTNTVSTTIVPEVVVGKSNQQATGITKVSVPANTAKSNSTITYKLDDKVVATTTGNNPSANIDTSTVSNGEKKLTATITKPSGEKEVLGGNLNVRNDAVTSSTTWFKENLGLFIFLMVLLSAGLYIGIYYAMRWYKNKQLADAHIYDDGYTFVQPTEQAYMQTLGQGVAVIMLFTIGVLGLGRIGTIQAATGFGFIAEIEDGVGDFDYAMSEDMSFYYARLSYTASTPSNPPTTPTTPTTPTAPPTTPTTPVGDGAEYHLPTGGHSTHNLQLIRPAAGVSSPLTMPSEGVGQNGDGGNGVGAFRLWCLISHMNYDDALVYPGQPNRSHLHMYFGNTSMNAMSTTTRNGAGSTCRGGNLNNSGYWTPSILGPDGSLIWPDALLIYYKTGYNGIQNNEIQVPHKDLQMIAGDPNARVLNHPVHFVCEGSDGTILNRSNDIGSCYAGQTKQIAVDFPQCWDGVNTKSSNFKTHMSYSPDGNGCPASHPVPIPEISMNFYYSTALDRYGSSEGFRLVTDGDGQAGASMHADWWNGWDEPTLETIVTNCLRGGRDCGTGELGDSVTALACDANSLSPDDYGLGKYMAHCLNSQ